MKNYNYIFNGIGWLGFTICLIIIIISNNNKQPLVVNAKTEIHKYYDSSVKVLPAEKIKIPFPVTFTVPVPANIFIDTAAILQDYFALNYYSQTIEDSCLRAIIKDTISKNKIIHRSFNYQWLQPIKSVEQTTITTTQKPSLHFYLGGYVQMNSAYLNGFGPQASLQLKNGTLISANYDLKKYLLNQQNVFELSTQFSLFRHDRTANKSK